MYDYNLIIRQSSERVFEVMAPRVSPEDLERIKDAFALAQEKHAAQKRKLQRHVGEHVAVAVQMVRLQIQHRGGFRTEDARLLHLERTHFRHRPLRRAAVRDDFA